MPQNFLWLLVPCAWIAYSTGLLLVLMALCKKKKKKKPKKKIIKKAQSKIATDELLQKSETVESIMGEPKVKKKPEKKVQKNSREKKSIEKPRIIGKRNAKSAFVSDDFGYKRDMDTSTSDEDTEYVIPATGQNVKGLKRPMALAAMNQKPKPTVKPQQTTAAVGPSNTQPATATIVLAPAIVPEAAVVPVVPISVIQTIQPQAIDEKKPPVPQDKPVKSKEEACEVNSEFAFLAEEDAAKDKKDEPVKPKQDARNTEERHEAMGNDCTAKRKRTEQSMKALKGTSKDALDQNSDDNKKQSPRKDLVERSALE